MSFRLLRDESEITLKSTENVRVSKYPKMGMLAVNH